MHGLAIFEWDIKWSSQHDLLSSKVQAKVRGWVRGGLVRLVWMGTPCTTFTTMQNMRRGGPLRTEKFPDGVVGLPPHQQAAVTAGNSFLRFTASILSICRRAHIPAIVENPHASGLWRHPVLTPVWKWKETKQFVVDYCAYGTPWRKRTRLLTMWADLSQSSQRCQGSCGMCSFTGKPHVRLQGRSPGQGDRTKLAEAYPKAWCKALVRDLVIALRTDELRALSRYLD